MIHIAQPSPRPQDVLFSPVPFYRRVCASDGTPPPPCGRWWGQDGGDDGQTMAENGNLGGQSKMIDGILSEQNKMIDRNLSEQDKMVNNGMNIGKDDVKKFVDTAEDKDIIKVEEKTNGKVEEKKDSSMSMMSQISVAELHQEKTSHEGEIICTEENEENEHQNEKSVIESGNAKSENYGLKEDMDAEKNETEINETKEQDTTLESMQSREESEDTSIENETRKDFDKDDGTVSVELEKEEKEKERVERQKENDEFNKFLQSIHEIEERDERNKSLTEQ